MTCTHTSTVVSGKIHTPIHGHGVSSMCKIAHPTSPVVIQNRSRVIEMKCGFFLHKILKFVQPIPGRFPMAVWLTRFSFPFLAEKRLYVYVNYVQVVLNARDVSGALTVQVLRE
jgi:hypothetical protein